MYSHAISLIGKHLRKYMPENTAIIKNINSICAFTGEAITEGFLLKDVIGGYFTEYEHLKHNTEHMSIEAYLCLSEIIPSANENATRKNGLRVYNYYADEEKLVILKREDVLQYIITPKKIPFVLCVSYNNKKHTSFKATINYNNNSFIIRTDLYSVKMDMDKINVVLPIMQKWYSVVKGKESAAIPPTYFSKQEILTGKLDYKKVIEYGEDKAFEENSLLNTYRGGLWFELLVHCLNKT